MNILTGLDLKIYEEPDLDLNELTPGHVCFVLWLNILFKSLNNTSRKSILYGGIDFKRLLFRTAKKANG